MIANAYAVVLAGGRGERFWPLSTRRLSKQFLTLFGGKSLLELTLCRLEGLFPPDRIFVITNRKSAPALRKALGRPPRARVACEPFGRDTAAACVFALALVKSRDDEAAFCVLPSDHIIADERAFRTTLSACLAAARERDVLVTIGIKPGWPNTGLGYIEAAEPFATPGPVSFRRVRRFVEKPDEASARRYVRSGRFFWNAGMFAWSVRSLESALAKHAPRFALLARRLAPAAAAGRYSRLLAELYREIRPISIDYAVMEKAPNIIMAEANFDWDDVGTWAAVGNHFPADAAGNVFVGECEGLDSAGNIVVSRSRLTALIGVRDMVVVHTGAATLICPKSESQRVKQLVEMLGRKRKYRHLL